MKKITAALLALFVLCASAAWADRIEPEEPESPCSGPSVKQWTTSVF